MLLGLAGGKVGDLVFYRDGGEQRTRTRVIPKNPRSPLQMAQRVRMANVSALYRLLAPVVRDSFSNRPSNQSGYNAFASGTIELSPFMTKEMANADAVLPMPAVISKGVLSALPFTQQVQADFGALIPVLGLTDDATQTVGAVSSMLLAQYPSLQEGDKITAVGVHFVVSDAGDIDVYSGQPRIVEFELDSSSVETFENSAFVAPIEGGLGFTFGFSSAFAGITAASAVIVSRVDADGSLQTSFSRLALSAAAQSLYDGYRTEQALQDAIASYNAGSESILR